MFALMALKTGSFVFNEHGFEKGWCNFPVNFDPVWIKECGGFEAKDGEDSNNPKA